MKSALKDFLVCTIRQRDALRQALREDAHAMTYAELVARHRRAGKSDAALAGESPEVFLHPRQSPAGDVIPPYTTENDVLRFELTRGIKDEPACLPPSRTALAAAKFRPSYGEAEFQKLFRLAVAEAQRNGTVAVVLPLLKAVLDCHERFITAAVSEADDRDTTGSGVEFVELLNAQAALMPFRPIDEPEPVAEKPVPTTTTDAQPKHPIALLDDDFWADHLTLASKLGIKSEPLRKRLDRWRKANLGSSGWEEVEAATRGQPKYRYRVGAIRTELMKANASA